jgi:hypothetical protein
MKSINVIIILILLLIPSGLLEAQALVEVGRYAISEDLRGLALAGDSIYISTETRIIDIDISNPTAPRWISTCPVGAGQMDVYGCFVYAIGTSSINIFDFCVPYQPRFAGEFGRYTNPRAIAFGPDRVYSITQGGQLNFKEYDLIDPVHPSLYRQFTLPIGGGYANDIVARRNYAYVTFDGGGFYVIDVSDSTGLTVAGHTLESQEVRYIGLKGNHAYVTDISERLYVIDISNSSNPQVVGNCYVPGTARFICIQGNYAFIATFSGILEKVYIADPTHPAWVPPQYIYGSIQSLQADSDFIYIASGRTFRIFRFGLPVDIGESAPRPDLFSLSQNHPNPFNTQTTISYSLPKQSDVTFEAFDITGRKMAALPLGIQTAGEHAFTWDAEGLSSGIYFYRIKAGGNSETKKCLLLK